MKHIKLFEDFMNLDNLKGLQMINEYLVNDVIRFKKYLESPKSLKKKSLPHKYYYLFDDFILETGYKFKGSKENDGDKIISWIENNDKKAYEEFAEYLYNKIEDETLPIEKRKYPAWRWLKSPEIIKNQWLIHFTDYAKEISKDGFKYGAKNLDDLAATTRLSKADKEAGGYNFAFSIDDFPKYYSYYTNYGLLPKYGPLAVLFKASGIRVWHEKDQEYQVIFYGREATDIIPIVFGEKNWAIFDKDGRVLFENDDLDRVVKWAIDNYNQYRKKID
jgi:hypothetical protein